MTVSPARYAAAKRIALTTILKQPPDSPVPDEVRFRNEPTAFYVHFKYGDSTLVRGVSWSVMKTSIQAVVETVKRALDDLARDAK